MKNPKRNIEIMQNICAKAQARLDALANDLIPEGIDPSRINVSDIEYGKPPSEARKIAWKKAVDGPYWGDLFNNASDMKWNKKDTLAKILEWGYPELAEYWKSFPWKDTGK